MAWMSLLSAVVTLKMYLLYINYSSPQMRECFIYTNHKYIANRLRKFINEGVHTNKHSSTDMDLIMQILHEINKIQQNNIKINIQSIQKPKSKKKQQQAPQIVHPHFKLHELASEYAIKANTLRIIPTLT